MSTALEKPVEINPFAPPLTNTSVAEPELLSPNRESQRTLRAVSRLFIVADLSYVAICISYFSLCFSIGEAIQLKVIAYWVTSFVLWYATVAGLFRVCGFGFKTILTALILPVPLLGTINYLSAKQEIRLFMISNGYLPGFLGFAKDDAERNAMEQDPDYRPSIYFQRNGRRRKRSFSIGEALIILSFFGFAAWVSLI